MSSRRLEQIERKFEQVQKEKEKCVSQIQNLEEKLRKIQEQEKKLEAERLVALVEASSLPYEELKELLSPGIDEKGVEHVSHNG